MPEPILVARVWIGMYRVVSSWPVRCQSSHNPCLSKTLTKCRSDTRTSVSFGQMIILLILPWWFSVIDRTGHNLMFYKCLQHYLIRRWWLKCFKTCRQTCISVDTTNTLYSGSALSLRVLFYFFYAFLSRDDDNPRRVN